MAPLYSKYAGRSIYISIVYLIISKFVLLILSFCEAVMISQTYDYFSLKESSILKENMLGGRVT